MKWLIRLNLGILFLISCFFIPFFGKWLFNCIFLKENRLSPNGWPPLAFGLLFLFIFIKKHISWLNSDTNKNWELFTFWFVSFVSILCAFFVFAVLALIFGDGIPDIGHN